MSGFKILESIVRVIPSPYQSKYFGCDPEETMDLISQEDTVIKECETADGSIGNKVSDGACGCHSNDSYIVPAYLHVRDPSTSESPSIYEKTKVTLGNNTRTDTPSQGSAEDEAIDTGQAVVDDHATMLQSPCATTLSCNDGMQVAFSDYQPQNRKEPFDNTLSSTPPSAQTDSVISGVYDSSPQNVEPPSYIRATGTNENEYPECNDSFTAGAYVARIESTSPTLNHQVQVSPKGLSEGIRSHRSLHEPINPSGTSRPEFSSSSFNPSGKLRHGSAKPANRHDEIVSSQRQSVGTPEHPIALDRIHQPSQSFSTGLSGNGSGSLSEELREEELHETTRLIPDLQSPSDNSIPRSANLDNTSCTAESAFESSPVHNTTTDSHGNVVELVVTVYSKEQPFTVTCSAPKIVSAPLVLGGSQITACDPKVILGQAIGKCDIHHLYKPMFGLWNRSTKKWVVLSRNVEKSNDLELLIRFTVTIPLDAENESNNNESSKERAEPAFSPLCERVLRYLFYQRRHQFLQVYPVTASIKSSEDDWLKYLMSDEMKDKQKDGWDDILCPAVFDEFRKKIENGEEIFNSGKKSNGRKLIDILPATAYKEFESRRWFKLTKFLKDRLIWRRFSHLIKISLDQLDKTPPVEYIYIVYISYVEMLEPSLSTELFFLASNQGAIRIDGNQGITIATKHLDDLVSSGIDDSIESHNGIQVKATDGVKILQLDFSSIGDMMIMPNVKEKVCISDNLGNQLVLPFENDEEAHRFAECVNVYTILLVDPKGSDCSKARESLIHGPMREQFIHKKLQNHPKKHACIYRQSKSPGEFDVYIKTIQENESIIQRSQIRDDEGGFHLVDCPKLIIPANSIDEYIKKLPAVAGDMLHVTSALRNIIKPSVNDGATLLKRKLSSQPGQISEKMTMPDVPNDDFAAVMAVFAGDFTQSMVTKYVGKQNKSNPVSKYVLLTKTGEIRGREDAITREFQKSMELIFQVRHHRHILRQLGNGVTYHWRVLEHSEWGDLVHYFAGRTKHGAMGHNDIMTVTGHWLVQIFYQLAHALSYLASKNLHHGGVRAENVIIFQASPTPLVKLSHPGVRHRELSDEEVHIIPKAKNESERRKIPMLPLPWLAFDLCAWQEGTQTVQYLLEADVWAFAATVCEIIECAQRGHSFPHICKYLEFHGTSDRPGPKNMRKIYEEGRKKGYCHISKTPEWLEFPSHSNYSTEKFSSKLKLCWNTNPLNRPTIQNLLFSLSILARNEVGKDHEIVIDPDNHPVHFMKFEEITTFKDSDLIVARDGGGSGFYGEIQKCKKLGTNRYYAVKDMKKYDHDSMSNFTRELRTMLRIDHENIVKIEGMTVPTQRIVMEYVEAGSLKDFIEKHDFMEQELITLCCDIAKGLKELHRLGILHRDLALRNILLKKERCGKNGSVCRFKAVISDFGLSRIAGNGEYYLDYGSNSIPENWYPPESLGSISTPFKFESDIWSYGITLWEMYSKQQPVYRDRNGAQLSRLLLKQSLDCGLRLLRPVSCPRKLFDEVISLCWKTKPKDRIRLDEIINKLNSFYVVPPLENGTQRQNRP